MFAKRKQFQLQKLRLYERALAGEVEDVTSEMLVTAKRLRDVRKADIERYIFVDCFLNWGVERGIQLRELYTLRGRSCYHDEKYKERRRQRFRCCTDHDIHE